MNHVPGVGPAVILAFGTIIFWHYTRNFRNGLQAFRRGRRSSAQQSMRETVMIGQHELRKLVKYTLADLQKTKSRDLFTPDLINTIIGNKAGQNFLSMKLKEFYANSGATASSLSPSAGRYGSSATASRLAPSKSEIRNQRLLF
jgi:hypothetical protein